MIKTNKTQSFILLTLSSLFLLFIFWIALAPTQLGGWVTYAMVDGNSMEPGFHYGDLVLVRAESTYGVGDAVVYRNAEMKGFVFHRIVKTDLDHFILQGDNNSWLDSYHPVQDEIVGKLWVHLPKLGKGIQWARVPINMSLTVGLLGGVFMMDMLKKPSRNKKEKKATIGNLDGAFQGLLYGFGLFALLFLALGIYSFIRPSNIPAETISYQQEGNFFYSAAGTPGVYDTDVIHSGEPIFPKLTCFLNVGFTYNIVGDRLQGLSGNHTMYARVLDEQSGWQRTIPLNQATTFNGNSYFAVAALDLCQVESLVNLVEQQAGLKQIAYTLEIVADESFTANVDGVQINDSFSPSLIFKYDKVHFYLADEGAEVDPLHSSKTGLAGNSSPQPNTISFLGLRFSVWSMRLITGLGFIFSLLGLSIAGINIYHTISNSQETLIRLKYGALLVDVHEQNVAPTSSTIDVAKIDDLVRLAERQGAMILHMTQNFLHTYLVQNNGATYRYVISTGKKGTLEAEPTIQKSTPRVEVVHKEPIVAPEPNRKESTKPREEKRETKTIAIFPTQNEATQPVIIPAEANKTVKLKQVSEEPVNYVLDTSRFKIAKSYPQESIAYIIDTGEIEVEIPQFETMMLRKVKL